MTSVMLSKVDVDQAKCLLAKLQEKTISNADKLIVNAQQQK